MPVQAKHQTLKSAYWNIYKKGGLSPEFDVSLRQREQKKSGG
jgi:hypothetical protein